MKKSYSQCSTIFQNVITVISAFLILSGVAHAGAVNLPQTGQTSCYDSKGAVILCSNTGQDGETRAGVAWPNPRFTDNGDGTITDNLTGLMWLKDGGCLGRNTWSGSFTAVTSFNNNPGSKSCKDYTANLNDWRVPNIIELESLVNTEVYIADLNGQGFSGIKAGKYWSATSQVGSPSNAWYIDMNGGGIVAAIKSYIPSRNNNPYYDVLPVRSGQ